MNAPAAMITLRPLLWAWAAVGIGVWLALVLIAVPTPEERPDDLAAHLPAWMWVTVYAALVGVAFFLSGLVIAFVWTVVDAWREVRRERSHAQPPRQ